MFLVKQAVEQHLWWFGLMLILLRLLIRSHLDEAHIVLVSHSGLLRVDHHLLDFAVLCLVALLLHFEALMG